MTSLIDILLLAVGLAMDCFTISIVSGVILGKWRMAVIMRIALLFGLFQAVMPLIGWAATVHFSTYIEAYDHWVAFALLLFLGGKMILGALRPDNGEESRNAFNPTRLATQLTLAIATSIDALAVGIAFSATGHQSVASLALPLTCIGLASFLFSIIGHGMGIKLGLAVKRIMKPELLGGAILIAIGVKVLLSHLAN